MIRFWLCLFICFSYIWEECARIGGGRKEMKTGFEEGRLDDNKIDDDRTDFSSGLSKSFSRFQHFFSVATFSFDVHHIYMSRVYSIMENRKTFFLCFRRMWRAVCVYIQIAGKRQQICSWKYLSVTFKEFVVCIFLLLENYYSYKYMISQKQ